MGKACRSQGASAESAGERGGAQGAGLLPSSSENPSLLLFAVRLCRELCLRQLYFSIPKLP